MKKPVSFVAFQSAVTAPPALGGEISLSHTKHDGIEMMTGEDPGFLTIRYKGHEVGIPLMNVKSLVWVPSKNKLSS